MSQHSELSGRRLAIAASIMLAVPSVAVAQGSGSSRATPSPPRQQTVEEYTASFWQYINRDGSSYQKWQTVQAEFPQGIADEHHDPRTVYLNSVASKDRDKLPFGSILVRPQYGVDGKALQSINVMYRIKSNDSDKLEWYWLSYLPSGVIAKTGGTAGDRLMAGRVRSCIECHQKASGGDFVFPIKSVAAEEKK
jgi:hypothetical protein